MKKALLPIFIGFLFSHVSMVAYADTTPVDKSLQENVAQPTEQTKETPESAISKPTDKPTIPKLAIRWECKECTVNEKVAPLLEKSYAAAATKDGYLISDNDSAEMIITEFRQRPPGARVMFGIFAGKDKLGVRIVYHGKERNVEDYWANAWFGMNSLCESVAKKSFAEVLTMVSPTETSSAN